MIQVGFETNKRMKCAPRVDRPVRQSVDTLHAVQVGLLVAGARSKRRIRRPRVSQIPHRQRRLLSYVL
jgi:hypothetical protein